MCLIAFAFNEHPKYPFVFLANRDEFHHRPAQNMQEWDTEPPMLAGKDLKAGGTWLGMLRDGRLAAVTNVRDIGSYHDDVRSRGEIPTSYLLEDVEPARYAEELAKSSNSYNGFNVLIGSTEELWYASNRGKEDPKRLDSGIHTLSNAALSTRWFKTERAREKLTEILSGEGIQPEKLFELLRDAQTAPPDELPDTGLSPERERQASSIFIQSPDYGTRCSTIVLASSEGRVLLMERSYDRKGDATETKRFEFEVEDL